MVIKHYKGVLIGVILFAATSFSQDSIGLMNLNTTSVLKKFKNDIGAAAGFITGPGISYRYWLNNKYGVQATFLPYYNKNESEKKIDVSLGITGLRMLSESEIVNLYIYLGSRVHFTENQYTYYINGYYYPTPNISDTKTTELTLGGGPAIEVKCGRISLNVMVGIRGMTDFNEQQQVDFSGEACVFYCF
jgi:hypothetical protein